MNQFFRKYRRALVVAAAAIFGVSFFAWAGVRGLPDVARESIPGPSAKHSVSLDYQFWLSKGTLYPQGMMAGPERKSIPMKLVSWGKVTVTDEIASTGAQVEAGTYRAYVRVVASDLWYKDYALVSERKLDAEKGVITVSADLPIKTILANIKKIEEEIGLGSPNGKYVLEVRLDTSLDFPDESGLDHDYTPVFAFTLTYGRLMLETPAELALTQSYGDVEVVEKTNTRFLFGKLFSVESLKKAAQGGLGASAVLVVAALGWSVSVGRSIPKSPARRYRDRLVKVTSIGSARVDLSVRVQSLKELVRMADEAQVTVMELEGEGGKMPPEFDVTPTPELRGRKYFVVSGNTLYYVV